MRRVDPITRALELRETLIKGEGSDKEILVTDFSNTLQGKDTSKVIDLMPNTATGDYVFRAKFNVKELCPIASEKYGVEFKNPKTHSEEEIIEFVKRKEFDFPLWYKNDPDFSKVIDYNVPFIMQVAGCNFHDGTSSGGCWYCFVDDKSNNGLPGEGKAFLRPDDAVESMLAAREKIKEFYKEHDTDMHIRVFRYSGGEPTIALDWLLEAWRNIEKRGLDYVGQLDSNLSTARIVKDFEQKGIYEDHILEKLAEYPIHVLTAIKGVSNKNIMENVQSSATLKSQYQSIENFLKAGFKIRPQMYNADPEHLEGWLEDMDSKIENFSLVVHLGPLKVYGPNTQRLTAEAVRLGQDPEDFIVRTKKKWDSNYERGCEVMEDYLQKNYGVGYKDTVRSDVELRLK